MALGALLLLFYPTLWVYGRVNQIYLHRQWIQQQTLPGNSDPSHPHSSDTVGRLVIPSINVDQIVVEGVGDEALARGPGHFPSTALPGTGNCVVAGHLNVEGSPFRDLQTLKPGQLVLVQTRTHLVHYVVTRARVIAPSDVAILGQRGPRRLTLVTCMPGARMRYAVWCKQTLLE
jgi:sortase A